MAAALVAIFHVNDFDEWKPFFDSDPVGRKEGGAVGHRLMRSVDDGNEVFVRVDFPDVDTAKTFREKLLASDALKNMTVVREPTVVELADDVNY